MDVIRILLGMGANPKISGTAGRVEGKLPQHVISNKLSPELLASTQAILMKASIVHQDGVPEQTPATPSTGPTLNSDPTVPLGIVQNYNSFMILYLCPQCHLASRLQNERISNWMKT